MYAIRSYYEDFGSIVLSATEDGSPIRVSDIGEVTLGPDYRRGVADLDGTGDVVSGIIVMREDQNALVITSYSIHYTKLYDSL